MQICAGAGISGISVTRPMFAGPGVLKSSVTLRIGGGCRRHYGSERPELSRRSRQSRQWADVKIEASDGMLLRLCLCA
jgi:hypothetical protein